MLLHHVYADTHVPGSLLDLADLYGHVCDVRVPHDVRARLLVACFVPGQSRPRAQYLLVLLNIIGLEEIASEGRSACGQIRREDRARKIRRGRSPQEI